MKRGLTEAPVLGYPDSNKIYVPDTDANNLRVRAVLSQIQDREERVIAYYSKTLTQPENNYCITGKELLAMVKTVKHFKPYLYGQHVRLRKDRAPLK